MSTHSSSSGNRMLHYTITRNGDDEELVFDPAKGTKELRDALHFHFPEEEDYKARLQSAIFLFCEEERSPLQTPSSGRANTESSTISLARTLTRQSSSLSSRRSPKQGGNPRASSRSRRRYDPGERRKVRENRGNVCQKHTANHGKCDPDICEGNRLYARRAARREEEHTAQFSNAASNFLSPYQTDGPNFGPYTQDWFSASQPNINQERRRSPVFANGYERPFPLNMSMVSLPKMHNVPLSAPPLPGHTPSFFYDGPTTPLAPSNRHPEPQVGQTNVADHENTNHAAVNFEDLIDYEAYHGPAGARNQDRCLLNDLKDLSLGPSKCGPIATIRRKFSRLFKTNSILT